MKSNPAILQVIPHLETGGAELSTLEIVDALVSVGVRALVATQGGRMASEVEQLGGELIPLPAATKNPLEMYRNRIRLEKMIVERDVALLHVRSRAPAWSSLWASTKLKLPFVTTYHGAYGEVEPFKRLYNSVMARGHIVIANSRFTADLVRARHNVQYNRLRVIYRGVDIERYDRSNISDERLAELRTKWQVPKGSKIILHPARLTRWKGQGVVIRAIKNMMERSELGDVITIIAGDHQGRQEYIKELQQDIKAYGLENKIRLVGHCSDMAAAYALAHVTIIASIEPEAFGRTSAEAQAVGCPVIATKIGAPPETVRAEPHVRNEEMTGWLVSPDDPLELASALGKVLKMSEQDYRKMALRATENVEQNFSDKLMKSQTLAIYDELLGSEFSLIYEEFLKRKKNLGTETSG